MSLFDRRVVVTIGPEGGEGLRLDERFHIEFSVVKTVGQETNRIDCTIYGLSDQTRARINDSGSQVIQIEAGYADGVEVLAIGDITRVVTEYHLPEIRTVIEAGDGARALRDRRVNLSFEAGASVQRVLDRIAQELALGTRATGARAEGAYREGVSFSGTARDALNRVTQRAGLTWSIQNGELQILDRVDAAQGRGVLLTPQTGLIGSPRALEEQVEINERRRGDGFEVVSLLQPKIRPGELVVIQSRDVDGQFRVDTVTHSGSTRGNDWETTAEVYSDG